MRRIRAGAWRNDAGGPMQVVSGPIGRQHVHYEAPPAGLLDAEMEQFLSWLNGTSREPALIKAGIGHLWFVTLHPFDDGNGRIARAIGDLLLDGFEGKLTTSKWAALAKCSTDTALRDINELVQRGILQKSAASGRSTNYEINNPGGTHERVSHSELRQ